MCSWFCFVRYDIRLSHDNAHQDTRDLTPATWPPHPRDQTCALRTSSTDHHPPSGPAEPARGRPRADSHADWHGPARPMGELRTSTAPADDKPHEHTAHTARSHRRTQRQAHHRGVGPPTPVTATTAPTPWAAAAGHRVPHPPPPRRPTYRLLLCCRGENRTRYICRVGLLEAQDTSNRTGMSHWNRPKRAVHKSADLSCVVKSVLLHSQRTSRFAAAVQLCGKLGTASDILVVAHQLVG